MLPPIALRGGAQLIKIYKMMLCWRRIVLVIPFCEFSQ